MTSPAFLHEAKPGQFPKFELANIDYRGYRYRPELANWNSGSVFQHWVYHPCGFFEAVLYTPAFHLTPSQFRLLVDLDLPEPSEFPAPNSRYIDKTVYTPEVLHRIARYREDNGTHDIDVMLVMMTLADYSIWTGD